LILNPLEVPNAYRDSGSFFIKRHGYPWAPTDQGLGGPRQVTQPAKSPTDLQVGPETLSTTLTTLEELGRSHLDSGRPAGLVAQASP
jgi:hypothetical protein